MSLIDHLDELRSRIIKSAIAIAVCFGVCFAFRGFIFEHLLIPLHGKELITLSPTETFMTVFKVTAYCGVIVASPYLIYQIWAFVAPGLHKKEKKTILISAGSTSILFLMGIAFCWFFVMPRVLDFLLNYESDFFNSQVQAAKYFSFAATFLLGFGVIFITPVFILTLVRVGIVDTAYLAKNRKYAILIGCVFSAILTPQDIFSMMSMALPFIVLYEMSIHLSRLVQRSKRKKKEAEEASEDIESGEITG